MKLLLIIFILGIFGLMFYVLFKPLDLPERKTQIACTLDDESIGYISKVSYSEANQNV